jgi:hypothetical protein
MATCDGECGTVVNGDPIRRTLTIAADGEQVHTTVLPQGAVRWDCGHGCTIELDGTRLPSTSGTYSRLRIEHGVLKPGP